MSTNEKSSFKKPAKKYLYLDRFEKHVEVFEESQKALKKLENRTLALEIVSYGTIAILLVIKVFF